jgi:hypothetical protein
MDWLAELVYVALITSATLCFLTSFDEHRHDHDRRDVAFARGFAGIWRQEGLTQVKAVKRRS